MIVITGAGGFIGSALVYKLNLLSKKDLLLVDQDLKGSPKEQNLKKKHYEIYLESDEFLKKLEDKTFAGKIDSIFHLGACSDTTEDPKGR